MSCPIAVVSAFYFIFYLIEFGPTNKKYQKKRDFNVIYFYTYTTIDGFFDTE